MSLFPRFDREFAPLFRMFDDFDRQAARTLNVRSFSPKFDVKETKDSYELHGEFPGIEQKNINIEWTDANTLTVSGRTETVREEGQRPTAAIENGKEGEHYHKPTVEDEAEGTTSKEETQMTTRSADGQVAKHANGTRYWVSERSVGEFHRSFAFPQRVDQEAVKASLKNGILSIVVPKASAPKPRKIEIE